MSKPITFLLFCGLMIFSNYGFSQTQQPPDTMWTRTLNFTINSMMETNDHNIAVLGDSVFMLLDSTGDSLWKKPYGGNWLRKTNDNGFIIIGNNLIKTNYLGDTLWTRPIKGYSVIQTFDGGYAVLEDTAFTMTKVDSLGVNNWSKQYNQSVTLRSITQTNDGGFVLVGFNTGAQSVLLLKINSLGDTLWTKVYSSTNNAQNYRVTSVQLLSNGKLVVVGDAILFSETRLVDSLDSIIWDQKHGSPNGRWITANNINTTYDNGFILTGSGAYDCDIGCQYSEAYIIKMDSLGDLTWAKSFSFMNYNGGNLLQQTSDRGFLLTCDGSILVKLFSENEMAILSNKNILTNNLLTVYSFDNPIISNAAIAYYLNKNCDVEVKIISINNNENKTIISGMQEKGKHYIKYDVKRLKAGIYILEFKADGFTKIFRVVIL